MKIPSWTDLSKEEQARMIRLASSFTADLDMGMATMMAVEMYTCSVLTITLNSEQKPDSLMDALKAVDNLWTHDASLGYEQEMSPPSPVGLVWQQVKNALEAN